MTEREAERAAIVKWLRDKHEHYHQFAGADCDADYETGKAMAFLEAAIGIQRRQHLQEQSNDK